MSEQVWKFALTVGDQFIEMPLDTVPLVVQMQGDVPTLWAEVDTTAPKVTRRFYVAMTGEDLPVRRKYIGTAQREWFVMHVYEVSA